MAFGAWSQVFDPEVWSASQWGTKYYSLRIYYRYRQDVAANITQFELQGFRFYTLTSARGIHAATLHGYFSVNYTDQGYKTIVNSMPSPPGNTYLPYNMTVDVPHNTDGTYNTNLYIAWRFYVTGSSDSIQPNITTSQRVNPSIPKIPRVSSASVQNSSVVMGNAQKINIGRQTTSYTHNIYYKFTNQSSWTTIATGINADSYSWTVPTGLASSIPNATSGTCQILVRTMSGSTQIGDSITSFTATVPTTVVPTISTVTVAETTSGLATQFGAFIQSKSGYKCTVSASGASGSTIKTYRVEMSNRSASGSSNVLTLSTVSSSGNLTLKTTVTDSRGRTATKTQTVTVLAYNGASCSLTVARCNASGVLDDEGTRIKVTYSFAITALNNKNTRSLKIQWLNGSTWTDLMSKNDAYTQENNFITAESLSFSVDKSYQFRAVCADYFGSVTVERTVDTSFSLIDLGSDGRSIAFGGVADDNGTLHSKIPSKMKLYRNGGSWIYGKTPQNHALYWQGTGDYIGWETILGVSTTDNHSFSLGKIYNQFGVIGFKSDRTANGYDCSLLLDVSDGSFKYNGSVVVNDSRYYSLAKRWQYRAAASNGTSGLWCCLGTMTTGGDTRGGLIRFYTGAGYNGNANQNTIINIQIKDGWQSALSATKAQGGTYWVEGYYHNSIQVQVRASAHDVCQVWVYLPWTYWDGVYEVFVPSGSWAHSGAAQSGAPTSGTAQEVKNITPDMHGYHVNSLCPVYGDTNPASLYGGTWEEVFIAIANATNSEYYINNAGGTIANNNNIVLYKWDGTNAGKWHVRATSKSSNKLWDTRWWVRTA